MATDYNKIEQQEKPETKKPTDAVQSDTLPAAMTAPDNAEYEEETTKAEEEPKKSLLARFIDLFVGSNGVKAAATKVMRETVRPTLTSLGVDFLENTLETMVYGTSYNRNNYSNRHSAQPVQGNQTQYNGMYARNQPTTNYRPAGEVRGKIRNLPEPMFMDASGADEFLDRLDCYIRDNGRVTVYQYMQSAGWISDAQPTDRNWGWYSIRSFNKQRLRDNGNWVVRIVREPEAL